MVETYETEGKEEGHKVWFLCFDQDSHDKLLAAIQEKTGQENPPRLEMDVIDGPKVADGRHRLPREPPELLLSGVRIRTIDQLLARDAAEAEQSEQASEHYNRADRVAAMNAARAAKAAKAAKKPAGGRAKGGGEGEKGGGKGGRAAFTDDDYYDDDAGGGGGGSGSGDKGGTATKGGGGGGGGANAPAAAQPEAAPKGPYNAATAYPDKEAPANIQRRRIPKAGTLNLTALESDVYDAIAGSYGIRANAISYVRKALGEAAHSVSDRDLQGALRELVKKRAIAVQYQTDTARVGSVDGSGERKVNKRVRVYVPVSYADGEESRGGGGGGDGAAPFADRTGEGRDGAATMAEAEAAAAASRGDETEAALQGRMDGIMEAAAPPKDNTPMGPVLRDDEGDSGGEGEGGGASTDADDDDDPEHGDAAIDGGTGEDADEDDISAVERERVDHGMDLAALADPTLITMLGDAGSADMHEAIRAELDRRKGQAS